VRIISRMSDDAKRPDPVDDLKKGLGLLFRAAKSAVSDLPTDKLEKVVVSSVKEVGRAIENVTDQIDRQIFHGKGTIPHPEAAKTDAPAAEAKSEPDKKETTETEPKAESSAPTNDEAPKGPRVA